MTTLYDVAAIGNAIVDVIAPASDAFLAEEGLVKGSMMLVDDDRADSLYSRMGTAVEASGGSAGNTIAGVASLGGRGVHIGKVAADALGEVYARDMDAIGARFAGGVLRGGALTGRCLINVTDDGERTMCTALGAAALLDPDDVDPAVIEQASIVFLEGYLFDPPPARKAFAKAAGLARGSGRLVALTLSDSFVVDRHREGLIAFTEAEVDVLFANADEIASLFQTADFDAAVEAVRGRASIAVVTRGEQGSVIVAGDQIHQIEAVRVEKVVDTTGAGDQYAAGFLFGLAQGLSLPHSGRLGSLCASEVISHYGPRPQVSLKDLARQAGL
ncbi:MAG TPA: adenosine kinase [Caulobacteraceae bacterium]|jgi:sugar/nucleoside kinase (ribokinase family)|nr:adenosine kinase [Caulobacteraceae bacterium]